jgi:arylsulfatase A-like enzyme
LYADFYKQTYDLSNERRGQTGNFSSYGANWAAVSATPFSNAKGSASEGGLRVPMIVSYPRAEAKGLSTAAFGFVTDVVATVLDAAGVRELPPEVTGRSLLPLLQGTAREVHGPQATAYELAGSRCVFEGQYELVMNFPPYGDKQWRLYDYRADPTESTDLSAAQPAIAAELRQAFADFAKRVGLVEVPADYSALDQVVKNQQRKEVKRDADPD